MTFPRNLFYKAGLVQCGYKESINTSLSDKNTQFCPQTSIPGPATQTKVAALQSSTISS